MRNVRRRFLQRVAAALLAIVMLTGCGAQATTDPTGEEQGSQVTTTTTVTTESATDYMDTIKEADKINLWYTNDELTSYLKTCALMFSAEHEIDVNIELVSSIDYLETINKETLNGNVADVYILIRTSRLRHQHIRISCLDILYITIHLSFYTIRIT